MVTITSLARARPVGPTSPAITRAGAGLVAGRLDLVGAVAGRHQSPKPDAPLLPLLVLHQTHSSCTPLPILTTPPSALHIFFAQFFRVLQSTFPISLNKNRKQTQPVAGLFLVYYLLTSHSSALNPYSSIFVSSDANNVHLKIQPTILFQNPFHFSDL